MTPTWFHYKNNDYFVAESGYVGTELMYRVVGTNTIRSEISGATEDITFYSFEESARLSNLFPDVVDSAHEWVGLTR